MKDKIKKHPTTEWTDLYNLGWSVIPLTKRAKRPAGAWKQYQEKCATADELGAWALDAAAELNVGIVTGEISGVVVLDIDSDDAAAEAERLGYIRHTVMVKTPRGLHVYYKAPLFELCNVVGQEGGNLPPGIDFRGDGGYVVGPGSYYEPTATERIKGKVPGHYTWADGCSPTDVSIKSIPKALLDALTADIKSNPERPEDAFNTDLNTLPATTSNNPTQLTSRQQAYADKALAGEIEAIATAPRGTANDTLVRAAFRVASIVAAGGLDHDSAKAALTDAALQRCDDASEARQTLESGWGKGLASPCRTMPADDDNGRAKDNGQAGGLAVPASNVAPASDPKPLSVRRASDVFTTQVPPREFLLDGWLPVGAVTVLSGDGGVGKSLLAMMIATAVAAGIELWGLPTIKTPTLAIYCEDDDPELIRRQHNINASLALRPTDLHTCYWSSRSGEQSILGAIDKGDFQPSALYAAIRQKALDVGARLIVLDNISHMYGEDGNDPGKVTRFMSLLNRLALDINGCVVLIGHIAKAEGSKFAGTAAWSNAARNRLFFGRPADPRKAAANPDHRELVREKSNYAKTGDVLDVVWHRGAFVVPTESDSPADNPAHLRDNQTFLQHLKNLTSEEVALSSKRNASNYAPKVMATTDRNGVKHHSKHQQIAMERAMARLLSAEIIADYEPLGWMRSGRKPATEIKLLTAKAVMAGEPAVASDDGFINFMAEPESEPEVAEPVMAEVVTDTSVKPNDQLIALIQAVKNR